MTQIMKWRILLFLLFFGWHNAFADYESIVIADPIDNAQVIIYGEITFV
ncbi:hypothetical protein SAMN02745146_1634 [Hymenobacter daecheongensis DSM 21074]|uniref:Uncharacterized protein n=1 Tax=Hymenobacter daecheongensis DSM 21074 TaxID=1121955 RepID=A0A1M6EBU8_9BACT|nr:hypothetical protein SAMN02745146_1634 [Hymenobacter daecheongensis DSM 21074]